MADIKSNNNKCVFGEDAFKVTNNNAYPEQYYSLEHDDTNVVTGVGFGSKKVNYSYPLAMPDESYFDLPLSSAGYGTFRIFGSGSLYTEVHWSRDNTVVLRNESGGIADTDSDGSFCIFDNTTSVRVKNRLGESAKVMFEYSYTELPIAPTFQIFNVKSGVDNLDPNLTINGTTVTPTFRYKGGDADGTDWDYWGYGEDLPLVSVATPPTYSDGSPGLGVSDDSVGFNESDYYKYTTDTDFGDLGTDDIVIEIVYKSHPAGNNYTMVHKKDGGSEGWQIQDRDDNKLRLVIEDSSSNTSNLECSAVTPGAWVHAIMFIDRNDDSWGYINGAGVNMGDPSAVGDLDSAVNIAFGASNTGAAGYDSNIAYIAVWKSAAGWHAGGAPGVTEWDAIAEERFAKFSGIYPQIANGTYMPTVAERTYPAYLDKVEDGVSKLYYVGSEWMRMCHRQGLNGINIYGYLPETAATNLIVESEDFLTTWTLNDAGDTVLNDQVACPDGRIKATSFGADSTDSWHRLGIDATLTAATYTFSCFVRPENADWVQLLNTTVANCYCFFDVTNGVIGTAGVGAVGYMEGPFFGDFYRCCIVFTGTVAAHALKIYISNSDTDNTFTDGDDSPSLYLWGAQCELGDYMTSPIITDGGTEIRLADNLQYVAGDNIGGEDVGEGTVALDVLFSNYNKTSSASYFYWIGDGTATADRIYGQANASDNFLPATRATAGNNGDPGAPATDIIDGEKHLLRHTYAANSTIAYADGLAGTEDTSCDIPDDVDTMFFAQSSTATLQPNCLIQNFRIYNEVTTVG
ncbi:hypothetical protein N8Z24_00315 [bacterium]|nr:hypothetical protein [bacterium]